MSDHAIAALAAVWGLCVGSFLNVCVFRWTAGESVATPSSRCRSCGEPVRWRENIPVLGYLLTRGRCARCGASVSLQYPLVEAATGLIWAWAAYYWGMQPEALRGAVFLTILLGIAVSDARTYLIPDQFSLGGAALGLATAPLSGGLDAAAAAKGAVLGFGLLWGIAVVGKLVFRKPAMGGGDVKMMTMVGAFLGPGGVLVTLFGGALVASVVFGPLSLRRGKLVPFGVFLAVAGAAAYVWGDRIVAWYLGLTLSTGPRWPASLLQGLPFA